MLLSTVRYQVATLHRTFPFRTTTTETAKPTLPSGEDRDRPARGTSASRRPAQLEQFSGDCQATFPSQLFIADKVSGEQQ